MSVIPSGSIPGNNGGIWKMPDGSSRSNGDILVVGDATTKTLELSDRTTAVSSLLSTPEAQAAAWGLLLTNLPTSEPVDNLRPWYDTVNKVIKISPVVDAIALTISYEQPFIGADGTPIADYGYTAESGTWTITNNAVTGNGSHRAWIDLGYRPELIEANLASNASSRRGGMNVRYLDSNNYYLARWSGSASRLQLYETVGGVTTLLSEAVLNASSSMSHTLRIVDDGTDIVVIHVDSGVSVTASDSVDFTNDHTESTRIAIFQGQNGERHLSVRAWQFAPVYNNFTNPEVMWGATEYWIPPGVYYNNKTYFGWISESGVVQIRTYNHISGQWSDIADIANLWTIDKNESRDDHNAPSIQIAADGTVLVFYAIHDVANQFFLKRSMNPEDISSFGSAIDMTDGLSNVYNYPQCYRLPNDDLIMFYRYRNHTSGIWKFKKSTDGGATWGSETTLVNFTGASLDSYLMTRQDLNNPNRIVGAVHLAASAAPTRRDIYYVETRDGGMTWEKSDGTDYVLPVSNTNAEQVYDSGATRNRITGLAAMEIGARILFQAKDDPDHEIRVAQLSGGSWETVKIADSEVWWDENGVSYYTGGGDVNPKNVNEIAIAIPVSGRFEIQKWTTSDNGATWAKSEDVTTASKYDQWRPMYFVNPHSTLDFCWCSGDYTGVFLSQWFGYDQCKIITPRNKLHRSLAGD